MTRTITVETRDSGLCEVVEIGDDPESEALMRELGWVRADVSGEDAKEFAAKFEETAKVIPGLADELRKHAGNGGTAHHFPDSGLTIYANPDKKANGFTPAGELEVGTPKEPAPDPCAGEKCSMCGRPAKGKVAEEILTREEFQRHPYGAYLCGDHFAQVLFGGAFTSIDGKKTLSELLDARVPAEIATGKHGNGAVAGVMATVAVLVELLSAELGRRF